MNKMEIYARNGGKDAELFAIEIGKAIAKNSGKKLYNDGKVLTLSCL